MSTMLYINVISLSSNIGDVSPKAIVEIINLGTVNERASTMTIEAMED